MNIRITSPLIPLPHPFPALYGRCKSYILNRGEKKSPLLDFGRGVITTPVNFFAMVLKGEEGSDNISVWVYVKDAVQTSRAIKRVGVQGIVVNLVSNLLGVKGTKIGCNSIIVSIENRVMVGTSRQPTLQNYVHVVVLSAIQKMTFSWRMLSHCGRAGLTLIRSLYAGNITTNLTTYYGRFGWGR